MRLRWCSPCPTAGRGSRRRSRRPGPPRWTWWRAPAWTRRCSAGSAGPARTALCCCPPPRRASAATVTTPTAARPSPARWRPARINDGLPGLAVCGRWRQRLHSLVAYVPSDHKRSDVSDGELSPALLREFASVVGEAHVLTGDAAAGYAVDWTGRFRGNAPAVLRPADTA